MAVIAERIQASAPGRARDRTWERKAGAGASSLAWLLFCSLPMVPEVPGQGREVLWGDEGGAGSLCR